MVDDSATIRAVIAKTLKLAQIPIGQLFQAADGRDAMAILETQWIDLVFCDLHMPRMTGIELVEQAATHVARHDGEAGVGQHRQRQEGMPAPVEHDAPARQPQAVGAQ